MVKRLTWAMVFAGSIFVQLEMNAQNRTNDELKAEREQLAADLKSKEYLKRQKNIDNLSEPPKSGVSNVDMLQESSEGIFKTLKANNEFLSKFKRELTDKGGGEIDVTLYRAQREDYIKLAKAIGETAVQVGVQAKNVQKVKDEVKSLSPMQAMPASRSVKYSSEALQLSQEELSLQLKLVNNLIATINSADNH